MMKTRIVESAFLHFLDLAMMGIFSRSEINEIKLFNSKDFYAYYSQFCMLEEIIKQQYYLLKLMLIFNMGNVIVMPLEYTIMAMDWKPEWGGHAKGFDLSLRNMNIFLEEL